jgi:uncharacterized membrane protein YdjX (TVP38/TMEM64 family)
MESLFHGNEFVSMIIFFSICFLQPILLPMPEAATVTAGSAVFGSLTAACISFVGTLLGIIVAYFIAKTGGQKLIQMFVKEDHIKQYQRYVSKNEISILMILFVIPILPDEVICIGAGMSGLRFITFLIVASVAKLITSFSLAYSFDYAHSLDLTNIQFILLLIGIIGIIMLISHISKKALLKRNNV